jgi:hypothetical protein
MLLYAPVHAQPIRFAAWRYARRPPSRQLQRIQEDTFQTQDVLEW